MKLREREPNYDDSAEFMKYMKKVVNKTDMLSMSITFKETLFHISKNIFCYTIRFLLGLKQYKCNEEL